MCHERTYHGDFRNSSLKLEFITEIIVGLFINMHNRLKNSLLTLINSVSGNLNGDIISKSPLRICTSIKEGPHPRLKRHGDRAPPCGMPLLTSLYGVAVRNSDSFGAVCPELCITAYRLIDLPVYRLRITVSEPSTPQQPPCLPWTLGKRLDTCVVPGIPREYAIRSVKSGQW